VATCLLGWQSKNGEKNKTLAPLKPQKKTRRKKEETKPTKNIFFIKHLLI